MALKFEELFREYEVYITKEQFDGLEDAPSGSPAEDLEGMDFRNVNYADMGRVNTDNIRYRMWVSLEYDADVEAKMSELEFYLNELAEM